MLFSGKRKLISIPILLIVLIILAPLLPLLVGFPLVWLGVKGYSSKKIRYGALAASIIPLLFLTYFWVQIFPTSSNKSSTTSEISTNKESSDIQTVNTPTPTPVTYQSPQESTITSPTFSPSPSVKSAVTSTTIKPTTTTQPTKKPISKPTSTATPFPVGDNSSSSDKDCQDFKSQAEAQSYFVSHGGSVSNNYDDLDRDRDGIACETYKY